MPYSINQIENLKKLLETSLFKHLGVNLSVKTISYNPDDTRNSITKIVFEVTFSDNNKMEISIEFDIENNLVNVSYINSTIYDIHLLASILQAISLNIRMYEKEIINSFLQLIPKQV